MGIFLTPEDLEPFANIDLAKAEAMIEDAEAMAVLAAPCITTPEFMDEPHLVAAVKAVLRGAILRWNDSGSGAVTQQGAGPFQQTIDTRSDRRSMFWPSEIAQLRDLCEEFSGAGDQRAFSFTPSGPRGGDHLMRCSLRAGASYCSCGVDIAGHPLYETGQVV